MAKLATILEMTGADKKNLEKIRITKASMYAAMDAFGKLVIAFYRDDPAIVEKYTDNVIKSMESAKSKMGSISHDSMKSVKSNLNAAISCMKKYEKEPANFHELKSARNYFDDAFNSFYMVFVQTKKDAIRPPALDGKHEISK